MNRNGRNITHSIKVASIFKVVVSTAILAIAGLSYVYLKNQLQQYGEIQRRLEHELAGDPNCQRGGPRANYPA